MLASLAVATESAWENPCGGVKWRTLPSGLVELEDRGTPMLPEGSQLFPFLEQTWGNWSTEFRKASALFGVPEAWLLAVATVETGPWSDSKGEQESIGSSASAIGVMQILPSTAQGLGYSVDDMYDGELNIQAGAKLLSILAEKRGSFVASMAPYNSGKLCSGGKCKSPPNPLNLCTAQVSGKSYGELAIEYHNTAIEDLGVGRTARAQLLVAGAIVAAGALWAWTRWR